MIAPSDFTRSELQREGFDAERIAGCPVRDRSTHRPRRRRDRRDGRRPWASPHRSCSRSAPSNPARSCPTIVRAIGEVRKHHPRLTLVVVGPRGWGEVPELDRSYVRVFGAQPWAVVDALYRRADAFCVASLYEGFGLPALEAMARGAPTITTTGSAMEEFVRDAGVLFAPKRRRRVHRARCPCARRRRLARGAPHRGPGPRRRAHLGTICRSPRSRVRTRPHARSVPRLARCASSSTSLRFRNNRSARACTRSRSRRASRAATDVDLHLCARGNDDERWAALLPDTTVHAVRPNRRPARLAWEQYGAPRTGARPARPTCGTGRTTRCRCTSTSRAVVTVHDLTFFDHPEWHERAKVLYFRRMIRAAAARADVVMCVSEFTAEPPPRSLQPRGARSSSCRTASTTRASRRRPTTRARSRACSRRTESRRRTSRSRARSSRARTSRRSCTRFARIAAAHPDLRLVLAGGDGWGADAVRDAIATSGVATRVVRPGYLDDDDSRRAVPAGRDRRVPVARRGLRPARARSARERDPARHHDAARPSRRSSATPPCSCLRRRRRTRRTRSHVSSTTTPSRRDCGTPVPNAPRVHVGTLVDGPLRRVPARGTAARVGMKALVTGATGFVGPHLCEHLRAAGDDVVGARRRTRHVRHHRPRRDRCTLERTRDPMSSTTSPPARTSPRRGAIRRDSCASTSRAPRTCSTRPATTGVRRVLVVGSAEEYGRVDPDDIPLRRRRRRSGRSLRTA